MRGVSFEVDEQLVERLRDAAVEAAIEAEVRRKKWEIATVALFQDKLEEKFGDEWDTREGILEFSDGDETVKLLRVVAPFWKAESPSVVYLRKLKSGKYAKQEEQAEAGYVLEFFRFT
jgi:hypothetical protein